MFHFMFGTPKGMAITFVSCLIIFCFSMWFLLG